MRETKRIFYFLPNFFTSLNMGCGFSSIILGFQGNIFYSCLILLLGGIFDLVDGRVARLTGTQSVFGEQFDSLSDVVSFGVAPSLLVYNSLLKGAGRLGLFASFLFLLCGALRLARFNANIKSVDSRFFQGLPIPSGAMAIIGLVMIINSHIHSEWINLESLSLIKNFPAFTCFYTIFYSLLMISPIPFYSFKHSEWVRKHKKSTLTIILLSSVLLVSYIEIALILFINIYIIGSLTYFILHRNELKNIFKQHMHPETSLEEEEIS